MQVLTRGEAFVIVIALDHLIEKICEASLARSHTAGRYVLHRVGLASANLTRVVIGLATKHSSLSR